VLIPDYLQRSAIATRVGRSQVRYSHVNRWAEPLEECFPRVLAQDLSNSLSSSRVILFPWPGNIRVDYQVQVSVERFELTSQGQAVLAARWLISDPQTGKIIVSGDAQESQSAGTDAATGTAALSQALAAMSESLALRIAQLPHAAQQARRRAFAASEAVFSFIGEPVHSRARVPAI
jgi:uncharacterized lipoprotein YmbA